MQLTNCDKEGEQMIAYVFPGQGSQYIGMGADLFDEYKELTDRADRILGYSIKELCMKGPGQKLSQTQYTQPGLFTVNALSYLKKVDETGTKPDYVAGHSLGEYNALFAANVIDFETGLRLVKKRGELMGQAADGGMAAVKGLTIRQIKDILINNKLSNIEIANLNTPSQIVLSGPKKDIEAAKPVFEAAGAEMYIVLAVSGAFHSSYMKESAIQFERFLKDFTFNSPQIPVISNITARPYQNEDIKRNLSFQIYNSVNWVDSIRYLMGKGEMEFLQIGPGNVLTNMVNTITQTAQPLYVEDAREAKEPEVVHNRKNIKSSHAEKGFDAERLGSESFRKDYNLNYAYAAGAMHNGIASKEMVVCLAKAGMLGFMGTSGLSFEAIEEALTYIEQELQGRNTYGADLTSDQFDPEREEALVDLYLAKGVKLVGASSYPFITPAIVRYRLQGLSRTDTGSINIQNKVFVKVSNIDIARSFLLPAPDRIVEKLLRSGKITEEQAALASLVPMAEDICIEDSAGVTADNNAHTLLPSILRLRDEVGTQYGFIKNVRVGAAGGIGTPESGASAFIQGADFIMTGSINQCTVEAAVNPVVKDLLQNAQEQDFGLVPNKDQFELGKKVSVLKKGVLFPPKANRLFEVYQRFNSLEEIDVYTRGLLEEKIFNDTLENIYSSLKYKYPPHILHKAEQNPNLKMALIFKWYFSHCLDAVVSKEAIESTDLYIYCSTAMGSFNRWVKGTPLENWRARHVDKIGIMLMEGIANVFNQKINSVAIH
jgi:malonyl CoA-acyl carrier protein transacylase